MSPVVRSQLSVVSGSLQVVSCSNCGHSLAGHCKVIARRFHIDGNETAD
jgi:hypothetical protein